jgi:hypothetical protein
MQQIHSAKSTNKILKFFYTSKEAAPIFPKCSKASIRDKKIGLPTYNLPYNVGKFKAFQ